MQPAVQLLRDLYRLHFCSAFAKAEQAADPARVFDRKQTDFDHTDKYMSKAAVLQTESAAELQLEDRKQAFAADWQLEVHTAAEPDMHRTAAVRDSIRNFRNLRAA